MSKNSNRSNGGGGRNDFPIFAAILLGIVMGLALAAVIAWFVLRKNPPVVPPSREPVAASKQVITTEKTTAKPDEHAAPPAQNDGKTPRFEFYKELTGKPDSTTRNRPQQQELALAKPAKPAEVAGNLYLQEGAYTNMDDAEKVKAKLALLGLIANIQPAQIPDKGLWYRVRLGPYKSTVERDEALATLKLNGLNAAPIKVQ